MAHFHRFFGPRELTCSGRVGGEFWRCLCTVAIIQEWKLVGAGQAIELDVVETMLLRLLGDSCEYIRTL